jgi:dTDP-4-amino-4,6-dideoxygalactose transaminase
MASSTLALLGGPKAITRDPGDLFTWPIITREDEEAVLDVLHRRAMSSSDVTQAFETEFAAWQGSRFALGFSSGTAAIQAAMFACGVGVGDEVISQSMTYWATCLQAFSLGGTVVFAEIDPRTLTLDPADVERRISKRTKAIVVVHYLGHPSDMDGIMAVARKHKIAVIEDVSHAQGGMYKGRKLGTFGDVAAMSLMTGKSLAIGEAGILVTDDRRRYERAAALGHYERFNDTIESPDLKPWIGLPLGGYKYRMHQMSSAVGRVQLRHYDARMADIQAAMNGFWDGLEGTPGLAAHRPAKGSGSTMGGWYAAHGLYRPEALGGLSASRFCEALRAEGVGEASPGANRLLHLHPLFNDADVYGHGKPTRIAHSDRDLRQPPGSLPVTEAAVDRVVWIPWFKKPHTELIDQYVAAYRKVSAGYRDLLAGDTGNPPEVGGWHFFTKR